jgi:flavodoxin
MNALVVYDTKFGNTRRIARVVSESLGEGIVVRLLSVEAATPLPKDIDLLIVGGPTHAHGASAAMKAFLGALGRGSLRGVPAAAFDTRFQVARWLSGSAAGVIAARLRRAGCTVIVPPESFFVARTDESPLLPDEAGRAVSWTATVRAALPVQREPAMA